MLNYWDSYSLCGHLEAEDIDRYYHSSIFPFIVHLFLFIFCFFYFFIFLNFCLFFFHFNKRKWNLIENELKSIKEELKSIKEELKFVFNVEVRLRLKVVYILSRWQKMILILILFLICF
jgi:hypothetical protein